MHQSSTRHEASLVKVQALWRGRRARRLVALELARMEERRSRGEGRQVVRSVVAVQRWWRRVRERRARLRSAEVLGSGAPSLATVVQHLHLLDVR